MDDIAEELHDIVLRTCSFHYPNREVTDVIDKAIIIIIGNTDHVLQQVEAKLQRICTEEIKGDTIRQIYMNCIRAPEPRKSTTALFDSDTDRISLATKALLMQTPGLEFVGLWLPPKCLEFIALTFPSLVHLDSIALTSNDRFRAAIDDDCLVIKHPSLSRLFVKGLNITYVAASNLTSIVLSDVRIELRQLARQLDECQPLTRFIIFESFFTTDENYSGPYFEGLIQMLKRHTASLQTLCLDTASWSFPRVDWTTLQDFDKLQNLWIHTEALDNAANVPFWDAEIGSSVMVNPFFLSMPRNLLRVHLAGDAGFLSTSLYCLARRRMSNDRNVRCEFALDDGNLAKMMIMHRGQNQGVNWFFQIGCPAEERPIFW